MRRREGTLRLTSTEAALLAYLTAHAGKPVPRGELLREVWGYAEGVASRSVDTAVRRLRAKIEIDKHHPAHLLSEHGVGYRFVVFGPEATGGSVVPIARSVEETVPPPRWRPRALPGELGPLIGRGRDLARLRDHVQAGVRLVTVTGPAGVGKTRLALRVALEERDRSEQDATFVDLSAARDAPAVVSGVAAALRYDLSSAPHPAERLGKWLSLAPPALLVLDNLEQLPPDAIQVVGDLLRSASALRVLATSRAPTGLPGEVVVGLDPLSPSDGAQLLFDRAKAAGCPASLRGTPAERQELSTLLDGLPLAIELAAPRLRLFGVKGLRERLEGQGMVATEGPVGSGVRRALDWTLALLTPEDRAALAALSCFAGAFGAADADVLLGPKAGRHLDALLSHSLLRSADLGADGMPRFAMYRSVHELATVQLMESGQAEATERRHAQLLLDRLVPLARLWEREGGAERLAALHEGRDDLLRIVERAAAWSPPDPLVHHRVALALYRALRDAGGHVQALGVVQRARAAEVGTAADRCLLALYAAESLLAGHAGERDAALADARELLPAGAGWLDGRILLVESWAAAIAGEAHAETLEEADRRLQDAGDHRGRALVLDVLAHTRRFAGELEASVALRRQAALLHGEQGSSRSLALSLEHLAGTLGDLRRWDEGLTEVGRAIAISQASGNMHDASVQRYLRASLLFGAERHDEARRDLEEVIRVLDTVGDTRFAGRARHGLGCIAFAQGDHHGAEEAFRAALRTIGDSPKHACPSWAWLAVVRYFLGNIAGGDEALERGRSGYLEHWGSDVGVSTCAVAEAAGALARWVAEPGPETAAAAQTALATVADPGPSPDAFVVEGAAILRAWAARLDLSP